MDSFNVVIAEDDPKIAEIQSRFIGKIDGFNVVAIANTIEESEDVIDVFRPDIVLLDVYFPDGSGIDLLWTIRRLYKNTDIILITAAKEASTLQEALRGGAFDYILKPMTFKRFQSTLINFIEHRNKLNDIINLEQTDVDQILYPGKTKSHTSSRIPKSIDPLTLKNIEGEIDKLGENGINAETMGERVGISRTTARRYLEFLVSKDIVKPKLIYGSVGRPERLYFKFYHC